MRWIRISSALAVFVLTVYRADGAEPERSVVAIYDFENDTLDAAPSDFALEKSESGKAGRWVVRAAHDAPSGKNVLMQTDMDRSQDRFLIAIADDLKLKDGSIAVHCKPIQGERDQACGVVMRYRDANNYYVARSNALEDNVRLYHVQAGKRRQLASWDGRVERDTWQTLALEIVGDRIRVLFNDQPVITHSDDTLSAPGSAGLWVKADSATAFDDVKIKALASVP